MADKTTFKSIRCGSHKPTPFLVRHQGDLISDDNKGAMVIVDMACGNGRNANYLKALGCQNVLALDKNPDYGRSFDMEWDTIPVAVKTVDLFLLQYCLMFVHPDRLQNLCRRINQAAAPKCKILYELQPVKGSYAETKESLDQLQHSFDYFMIAVHGFDHKILTRHHGILYRKLGHYER